MSRGAGRKAEFEDFTTFQRLKGAEVKNSAQSDCFPENIHQCPIVKGKHPPHPKITKCSQYPPKCRCEAPQYATMCQCKLSQYGTGMSLSATCLDLKSIFCILRSQIPSNCQTLILFSIFKESLTHYIYLQLNV